MAALTGPKSWRCTARDKAVLKLIGKNGFSSAQWIREYFSSGKSNCNHYRRLTVLRKMGLIEYMVGDGGKKLGYRLTLSGMSQLRSGGSESDGMGEYRAAYRTTYHHDNQLIGLGEVLRGSPGVTNYMTERQIRKQFAAKYGYKERNRDGYKVPDALFMIQTKSRRLRVALELEIALKAKAYYRRILRKLATSTDFDMVFVIVSDSDRLVGITRELSWVRANDPAVKFAKRDNGFYFALLADVLVNQGKAKFEGEGNEFTLAQIAT